MTRRHDPSPGDARSPFSDVGGPEGKHAQTHDLRAEELSNAKGPAPGGEDFAADIAPATPDEATGDTPTRAGPPPATSGSTSGWTTSTETSWRSWRCWRSGPVCTRGAPTST
jgi:hypothetical protein